MGMKDDGYEVLSDASVDAQHRRLAKMRQRRCVMNDTEQATYEYEPNGARNNKRPGFPDPGYGER